MKKIILMLVAIFSVTFAFAQVDMSKMIDPEFEEYHNLTEESKVIKADFTLLMRAAKHGRLGVVKALLFAGADVNATTDAGMTALMYASYYGHTDVVNRLVEEENIKVDTQNKGGYTALMFAAMNGHEDVVDLLITKGKANIHIADKKGMTAFLYAVDQAHAKVVSRLLDEDIDEDEQIKAIERIQLFELIQGKYNDVIDVLLEKGKPKAINKITLVMIDTVMMLDIDKKLDEKLNEKIK